MNKTKVYHWISLCWKYCIHWHSTLTIWWIHKIHWISMFCWNLLPWIFVHFNTYPCEKEYFNVHYEFLNALLINLSPHINSCWYFPFEFFFYGIYSLKVVTIKYLVTNPPLSDEKSGLGTCCQSWTIKYIDFKYHSTLTSSSIQTGLSNPIHNYEKNHFSISPKRNYPHFKKVNVDPKVYLMLWSWNWWVNFIIEKSAFFLQKLDFLIFKNF